MFQIVFTLLLKNLLTIFSFYYSTIFEGSYFTTDVHTCRSWLFLEKDTCLRW